MLAAYEVTLQQGAKDDAAWRRTRTQLYAEPAEVRRARREAARGTPQDARTAPARVGMTVDSAQALLASVAATDARYGAA